jgi:hypothetical protein
MRNLDMDSTQDAGRMHGLARKVLGTVLVTGLLASLAGLATWSAFSATSTNPTNQCAAGTVAISDNDAGSAMFNLNGMSPVDPAERRCIVMTYTGSLASTVRLYGATGGSGLADYLNVKVTRGSLPSPSFSDCTGFTADAADHVGLGAGVLYDGTLTGFADDYATGLVDPAASWTTGEVHAYRFEVTMANDDAAQGKTATQSFTWEARNA